MRRFFTHRKTGQFSQSASFFLARISVSSVGCFQYVPRFFFETIYCMFPIPYGSWQWISLIIFVTNIRLLVDIEDLPSSNSIFVNGT